jgi:hypothetical protein
MSIVLKIYFSFIMRLEVKQIEYPCKLEGLVLAWVFEKIKPFILLFIHLN